MMEQAGCAAGEQAKRSRSRRPAIPGLGLVRRPRVSASSAGHPGGVRAPLGGTMASCQELADGDGHVCAIAESAARRRKENAAAERREARRPTLLAGALRAFLRDR